MKMDVIITVIFLMVSGVATTISPICYTTERLSYCCGHHDNRTGNCTECSPGFTSAQGQMCTPCTNNTYGQRCNGICSCTKNQRCDNIRGCVPVTESTTHDSTYKIDFVPSTESSLHTKEIGGETNTDKLNTTGNVSVIIYLLCTGGLSVLIVIGIVFLQHRRQKQRKIRVSSDENHVAPDITDIGRDEFGAGRTESVYDMIDDQYFAENS